MIMTYDVPTRKIYESVDVKEYTSDEVRRDWKGFFQRWRNVTPDHYQETLDLIIKYEVTDNVYNILI